MKKVPNLRFKEFSGEWESRPLSELVAQIDEELASYLKELGL